MKEIKLVLCGLGNVGRAFVDLLAERREDLASRYGLALELVAAADIGGAAMDGNGLDPAALLAHLAGGGAVETLARAGRPGVSGPEAIRESGADMLVETTPANLTTGEPGRGHVLAALEQGMDVVSANKAPMVLFYKEVHELAARMNAGVHISAATAAALPTLDVGRVCLAGATIVEAEGILNGTTNFILTRMRRDKAAYADALAEAQSLGIAETDPSLDVEGRDTANKMVLIGNRILGADLELGDVSVMGITGVTPADIEAAESRGKVIKLVGTARRGDTGAVAVEVGPKELDASHPLAQIDGSEKAISYLTDTMDRVTVSGGKSSPVGAAAALLKDIVNAASIGPGTRRPQA